MKKAKFFIIAFIALFAGTYGMDAPSRSIAEVQVLFTGDNGLKDELFSILNNAKKQVLVAMYWITDESIINKLIELKKKGIDVQVIFDASSKNSISLMDKLLLNDIVPVILPEKLTAGIMHNKFLIVDNALVWTGSANFTKTAFDPKSKFFNNENVVILYSSADAQKFSKKFFEIEKEIIELYIEIILDVNNIFPEWIAKLSSILYKKNTRFMQIFNQLSPEQKAQLQNFFSGNIQIIQEEEPTYPPRLREEPATYKQRRFLEKENFYFEGMSKQEASDAIDGIIQSKQQKRSRAEYQTPYPPRTFRRGKPATYNQRKFLEYRGRFTEDMSKREAGALIGRIKQQEQEQYYKRPRYN